MTDTELLDGLQRLLQEHVTVLRTCRSGVKIAVADGSLEYFLSDDRDMSLVGNVREYFGGGGPAPEGHHYGPDIRVAVQAAIVGEVAV